MLDLQSRPIKAPDFIVDGLSSSWRRTEAPLVLLLRSDDICYRLHDDRIALIHLRVPCPSEEILLQQASNLLDRRASHDDAIAATDRRTQEDSMGDSARITGAVAAGIVVAVIAG
jgi:hypothetical protein